MRRDPYERALRRRALVRTLRSPVVRKAFLAFIGAFVFWFAVLLLAAWEAMLFIGIAHSYDNRVPDFGFATSFFLLLVLAIGAQLGMTRRAKR